MIKKAFNMEVTMAQDKKLVEAITSMDVDFAQWYTDVVKKAELMGYSSVKGCMIFKPAGYALWENIQHELDKRFKETGVENVYMPMFIPESLLEKEKDHVEGFAPEVAWVTYGGLNKLQERMCADLHQKHCSVISIKMKYNHTEIYQRYIISGARLCAGKRRQDHFFVQENFCGRRDIQLMLRRRTQKKELL